MSPSALNTCKAYSEQVGLNRHTRRTIAGANTWYKRITIQTKAAGTDCLLCRITSSFWSTPPMRQLLLGPNRIGSRGQPTARFRIPCPEPPRAAELCTIGLVHNPYSHLLSCSNSKLGTATLLIYTPADYQNTNPRKFNNRPNH